MSQHPGGVPPLPPAFWFALILASFLFFVDAILPGLSYFIGGIRLEEIFGRASEKIIQYFFTEIFLELFLGIGAFSLVIWLHRRDHR